MTGNTGYTAPTNGSPFQPPADMAAIYKWWDDRVGVSVATASALPTSGNWVGRTIFVADEGNFRVCTALPGTWSPVSPATVRFKGSILTSTAVAANTNISYTTIVEDTTSGWSATNKNWAAPFAGTYLICVACKTTSAGPGVNSSVAIMKNGTAVAKSSNVPTSGYAGAALTHFETLAAGDTVSAQITTAYTTISDSPAHNNFLEIVRLA